MPQVPSLRRRAASHRYICTKVLLAEGGETPFTEHCRNYENKYQILQTEIQKLKDQMQELHRDLTKHHSLINTESMEEILARAVHIDEQIAAQYSAMQTLRTMFEEACEETFQRVTSEQEIYEAQLHDLLQLKQENSYLMTIARQIGPYILSIAKVKERLDLRFQEPREPEDDFTETKLKIYQDSKVTNESQNSTDESSLSVYSRDSHRNKKAGIFQHEAPKNSGKANAEIFLRCRYTKNCHSNTTASTNNGKDLHNNPDVQPVQTEAQYKCDTFKVSTG